MLNRLTEPPGRPFGSSVHFYTEFFKLLSWSSFIYWIPVLLLLPACGYAFFLPPRCLLKSRCFDEVVFQVFLFMACALCPVEEIVIYSHACLFSLPCVVRCCFFLLSVLPCKLVKGKMGFQSQTCKARRGENLLPHPPAPFSF